MALVVIGRKPYDFPDKQNPGQRIVGVKIHCVDEISSPEFGQLTEIIGAKIQYPLYTKLMQLPIGAVIVPIYNKYGSPTDIIVQSVPDGEKSDGKK
ncbi:MAG: hypothetical protein [Inoviridae sp.]|nr:MAG: hypothetical protein [Inoviridae sp.]